MRLYSQALESMKNDPPEFEGTKTTIDWARPQSRGRGRGGRGIHDKEN